MTEPYAEQALRVITNIRLANGCPSHKSSVMNTRCGVELQSTESWKS